MPPSRPRADDSRSETSSVVPSQKDRATLGGGITKPKKNGATVNSDTNSTFRTAAINGALAATDAITNGAGAGAGAGAAEEPPQTDWLSIPIAVLHTYRAAYKIVTPASYTRPHAELIYNSSDIARRSPSQVLARRKLKELNSHRKKLSQLNGTSNSIKVAKSKTKEKDGTINNIPRDGRRKQPNGTNLQSLTNGDSIAQSIEPNSPEIASASSTSDSAPSSLLNSTNPEATIIGRQSPTTLATHIRKHFNAQPLHEHETIARFTYVMRQQGYGNATISSSINMNSAAGAATGIPNPKTAIPIRVEGSEGDGSGWVMGTSGREVRVTDSGGGGAFRLRFRPQV